MDIDILLALQSFRIDTSAFLKSFLAKMTFLGELSTVLVIMAAIYWCVSKEFGSYLLMGYSGNRLVNGILKITACTYRPWVRDSRILPDQDALTTATGYSFPSGHTTNAATIFGGVAIRKDVPKLLRVLACVVMVLIGFSRNYLGVHTPQDVLVGMAAGLLVMWLTSKLMQWIAAHPEKDILVFCIGIALAAGVAAYAALKQYPTDYGADGKILVDGAKMAIDTFKAVGYCTGFLSGWILERRFVGFSTDNLPAWRRITRLAVGVLSFYAVSLIVASLLKDWITGAAGNLVSCFIQVFWITFVFPWLLKLCEKPLSQLVKAGN